MKLALSLFLVGVVLLVKGIAELDDPHVSFLLEQRLTFELDQARAKGHPARLLVIDAAREVLVEKARDLAAKSGESVLAVSRDWATLVPSATDSKIAPAHAWAGAAHNFTWPYLQKDDPLGAASALVRLYTNELVSRGILPAVPPRPPIFLPDAEMARRLPSASPVGGLGAVLLVLALGRLLSIRARRAARTDAAP